MNSNNLTYRQKNIYLGIAGAVLLVVIYFFALSKTFSLYSSNRGIEKNMLQAEEAPEQIKKLEEKLKNLNSSFSVYVTDSLSSQDKILELVSAFCQKNNLTLKELPVSGIVEEADFTVETNIIVAEGNFSSLVKLLYELEYNSRIARLSSVNFSSSIDNKRKKTILTLTIYLQNIKVKAKSNENK